MILFFKFKFTAKVLNASAKIKLSGVGNLGYGERMAIKGITVIVVITAQGIFPEITHGNIK
ncbi:hypothetical protein V5097_07605 [Arenibacter palladensis]|uniref:hypothetical protein n=1 Tax=Arenibacter palladensis TaxID=237373 RepID=UPI002FD0BA1B